MRVAILSPPLSPLLLSRPLLFVPPCTQRTREMLNSHSRAGQEGDGEEEVEEEEEEEEEVMEEMRREQQDEMKRRDSQRRDSQLHSTQGESHYLQSRYLLDTASGTTSDIHTHTHTYTHIHTRTNIHIHAFICTHICNLIMHTCIHIFQLFSTTRRQHQQTRRKQAPRGRARGYASGEARCV